MTFAPQQPLFLTAALYKFAALPDFAGLQAPLHAVCEANQVKGTVLLASEGINGTIAGPEAGVRAVLAHLRADTRFADLRHKEAWAGQAPFLRLKIRLKKEIVTLGVPGVSPTVMAGQYVKPQEWNALISDPDVVLIDTRNDYEVDIGSFKGAIDPRTRTFADLPAWVAEQSLAGGVLAPRDGTSTSASGKKPKVAMFCTGGIRCEKSTALLRMHGFDEVYHLEGGILNYLETVPGEASLWAGECFVFDERVSVGHGLAPGPYGLCRSCRHPVGDAERASPKYLKGVSCPHCFDVKTEAQKQGFAERQRQVELARQRGQAHVGAKMPDKIKPGPEPKSKPQPKPKLLPDPVKHLLDLLAATPRGRVFIALAGLPGSGKSTVAAQLADAVNAEAGPGAMVALGMDGFHLTRAQLAQFPDPEAAFERRGAPWTFDALALAVRLRDMGASASLQRGAPTQPAASLPSVSWPGFDHGVGDPQADAVQVPPQTRLVLVKGLYLLHSGHGWAVSDLFDELWFLDVPMDVAADRLLRRHMAANRQSREVALQRLARNDSLNGGIVQASRARAQWLLASL